MAVIFNLSDFEINGDLRDAGVIDLDDDLREDMFERVDDALFKELGNPRMRELLASSVASKVATQIKRMALAEGDALSEVCKAAMAMDNFLAGAPSPTLCRFYGAKVLLGQQWPWLNSTLEKELSALGIGVGYLFYRDIGDEYTELKGIVWV